MKKYTAIFLILVMAAALAACGNNPVSQTETSDTGQAASREEPVSDAAGDADLQIADQDSGSAGNNDAAGVSETDDLDSRMGEKIADFSVTSVSGEKFDFSEVLKEKEGVLINFWASWCGPCQMEFPYMQEAYDKYKDRIEVISLSVEPNDTNRVIEEYANENNLSIMMANKSRSDLELDFAFHYIPANIMLDKDGKIVYISEGAEQSAEAFGMIFEQAFESNDAGTDDIAEAESSDITYTVSVKDEDGNGVSGCVVNFCDESGCFTVTEDSGGIYSFEGPAYEYHIQVIKVPDGYSYDTTQEYTADKAGGSIEITLK